MGVGLSYVCVVVVSMQAAPSVPLVFCHWHIFVCANKQNASWHEFGLCQPKPSPVHSLGMTWQLKCSQLLAQIKLKAVLLWHAPSGMAL